MMQDTHTTSHTHPCISAHYIKAEAQRLGFHACGIAPAAPVHTAHTRLYQQFVDEGRLADMNYLANHQDKRFNPSLLVPGVRSIICVALNYLPQHPLPPHQWQPAWYAYGDDYHDVMKQRLNALLCSLQHHANTALGTPTEGAETPTLTGRCFCDTAPVMERYWAWRSGLGWIGHNHLLYVPGIGSACFLGEVFIDAEVDEYDSPIASPCSGCDACVRACPTRALSTEADFDARKCLSYLTIENRANELPEWAAAHMHPCFYGCNRCLEACPHIRRAKATDVPEFQPRPIWQNRTPEDWVQLSREDYQKTFRGSAVKRAKYEGLMRNIHAMHHAHPPHTHTSDPEK